MSWAPVANNFINKGYKVGGKLVRNYRVGKMRNRIQKRRVGVARKVLKKQKLTYLPRSALQNPLPRCYHTRFVIERDFTIPSSADMINVLQAYPLNSPLLPLNYAVSASPAKGFIGYGNSGVDFYATQDVPIALQNPTGMSYLLNSAGPYTNFTVISSCIKFDLYPEGNDTVCAVIIPVQATTPVGQAVTNIKAQPQAKFYTYQSGKGKQSLVCNAYMHSLLGVSKQAYLDDLSGNYDGKNYSSPDIPWEWRVYMNNCNSTTTQINPLPGKVTITYNICLWNEALGIFTEE